MDVSKLSMNMFAKFTAIGVPIAVPFFCWKNLDPSCIIFNWRIVVIMRLIRVEGTVERNRLFSAFSQASEMYIDV